MANIHLVGDEKGGVGKSMVARLLAQYLIDPSIPFLGCWRSRPSWDAYDEIARVDP